MEYILARTGVTLDELRAEAETHGQDLNVKVTEVPDSPELRRILSLPRRPLDSGDQLAVAMTEALKTPWGTQELRAIQALSLHDIHQYGGAFLPIRVGGGKTLTSYLGPAVVDAKRPLLLVPAKLKEKTRREFRRYAAHWNGPHPDAYRIESYELVSRDYQDESNPGILDRYNPDFLFLDEAHKLKNPRAAVTRKVKRFVESHPGCLVVAASGTMTKRSLRDYGHIIHWCLPRTCPLPLTWKDLEAWALALDEKVNAFRRARPGALVQLCSPQEREEIRDADPGGWGGTFGTGVDEKTLGLVRQAFRRRVVETPGVVATQEGAMDMSLVISALDPIRIDPTVEAHFQTLRTEWTTPDGHPIADGMTLWRHARELALGFFYRWNPRPPQDWLDARKAWAKFCREVLKFNRRGLDSEAQVVAAVDRGWYADHGLLKAWREVRDTFKPTTEAVWFSSEALDTATHWLEGNLGIVWVEHVEFGRELARRTGLPFYSAQGQDGLGRVIEDHPPGSSLIASVSSNSEGRNLQAWNRNLAMSVLPSGLTWEQLLGRTHRDGQEADEVSFQLFTGCWEHVAGFFQAMKDATYIQDTQGQAQKLLYATVDFPDLEVVQGRGGFRWEK